MLVITSSFLIFCCHLTLRVRRNHFIWNACSLSLSYSLSKCLRRMLTHSSHTFGTQNLVSILMPDFDMVIVKSQLLHLIDEMKWLVQHQTLQTLTRTLPKVRSLTVVLITDIKHLKPNNQWRR